MKDTPKRVAKALREFNQPIDIEKTIGTSFEHTAGDKNGFSGMVVQSGIPFRALCEHHLLPMFGHVTLGYIPNTRVVGLSKLSRLVDAVGTEKPSLQEYISERICDLMEDHVQPKGVMAVISSQHACMGCRGINRPGVYTTTSTIRGAYVHVATARMEFFELAKHSRHQI
jgi:GTP cyclohydrolase I